MDDIQAPFPPALAPQAALKRSYRSDSVTRGCPVALRVGAAQTEAQKEEGSGSTGRVQPRPAPFVRTELLSRHVEPRGGRFRAVARVTGLDRQEYACQGFVVMLEGDEEIPL